MNSNSWCVKCAKYLAFGTFETADDSALRGAIVFDNFVFGSGSNYFTLLFNFRMNVLFFRKLVVLPLAIVISVKHEEI